MECDQPIKAQEVLLVLLCVAALALGGVFIRESPIGPINTAFYRVTLSLPMLLPFVIREHCKRDKVTLTLKDIIAFIFAGVFFAGDIGLWNISFRYTSMANANLFSCCVPIFIIPFCYFVYKEPLSKNFFGGLLIIFVGVFLLIYGKEHIQSGNLWGDALAFSSAIFYAAFLLSVYRLRTKVCTVHIMFYSALSAAVFLLLLSLYTEGFVLPYGWHMLLPLLGLSVFSQILGQGGLSFVLGRVRASLASVLMLVQPLFAALYAYGFYDEKLSVMEISALFVMLFGIYVIKKT